MKTPTFSIIIPLYNAADTLAATVRSVLAQSCQDFELILIDDGSKDASLKIMRELAATDNRIKAVAWANQGVSAARNFGVALSSGTLLAFLDADDLWHPEKLACHLALHTRQKNLAASYARIAFIEPAAQDNRRAITTSSIISGCLSVTDLLGENPVCTMSNLVVSRDCFDAVGPFRESMSFAEDQEWLIRAASRNFRIQGIGAVLVNYRLSHDGLSVDLDRMYAGWKQLAQEYMVPGSLPAAEAIYCRYLARRALRSGARPSRAAAFVLQGLRLDAKAFLSDARRGWLTLLSVAVSPFLPRIARLRVFA